MNKSKGTPLLTRFFETIVIRKAIWLVLNFRIFTQPIPISFSKYKTETANRGQRQLLENKISNIEISSNLTIPNFLMTCLQHMKDNHFSKLCVLLRKPQLYYKVRSCEFCLKNQKYHNASTPCNILSTLNIIEL